MGESLKTYSYLPNVLRFTGDPRRYPYHIDVKKFSFYRKQPI
jgi:hypothetical protein